MMDPHLRRKFLGLPTFFDILFGHRDISIYEHLWSMTMFHSFSWNELLDMLPWEFEAILSMTSGYLEKQELDRKQQALNRQM